MTLGSELRDPPTKGRRTGHSQERHQPCAGLARRGQRPRRGLGRWRSPSNWAASPWPSSFFSWNSFRQTLGLARSSRKPWYRGRETSSVQGFPLNAGDPKLRGVEFRGQTAHGVPLCTSYLPTSHKELPAPPSSPCWSTLPGLCPWPPLCPEALPHFIALELHPLPGCLLPGGCALPAHICKAAELHG